MVCDYELRPDRIGGMDRFFVAYDAFAKANHTQITWFFKDYEPFEFYAVLNIKSAEGQNVELFFLKELSGSNLKFDVLITHFTSLCSSFYKKARAIQDFEKVIVVDHNPRPLEGFTLKKQLKNKVKGFLYHNYIDQFVGVSEYTSRHIIKDLGNEVRKKTKTIYNGIDVSHITPSPQDRRRTYSGNDKLRLIIVSHLRESKGIQDALAALSQLEQNQRAKLEVHIYGTGPMEVRLKEISKENGLDSVVQFLGSSPNIPEILPSFDYLLQPTYMECFSLSILESLAANVPVITTTVGGNREIISDGVNGFLFEAKDVNTLVDILKDVLAGDKFISQQTRPLIQNQFNLDGMVTEHFKLIRSNDEISAIGNY
jgi:glycosyltransferase involved in cell wall biosynthesis